ncbi:MAG: hypothetical protein JWR23_672 [Mucilaginibacter sp.]|nr:hypothetical protein [Mucilaginibacter sp.]
MLKNYIASILLLFVIFTAKAQDQLRQQIAQIAKPA